MPHPSVADGNGGHWGGWGRTSNLPVNSRALCRLSYTPKHLFGDRHFTVGRGGGSRPRRQRHAIQGALRHASLGADGRRGRHRPGRRVRPDASAAHKLLAPFRGRPLAAYVLDVARRARAARAWCSEVVTVVAAGDTALAELAHRAGARTVVNERPERGPLELARLRPGRARRARPAPPSCCWRTSRWSGSRCSRRWWPAGARGLAP